MRPMSARTPTTARSFCETVTARALAPWHIRERDAAEPLKPNGGLFTQALCGRDLAGGWDLPAPQPTPEQIDRLGNAVCRGCADAARAGS